MNKSNLRIFKRFYDLKKIYEHFRKYEYLDDRTFNLPHSSVVYAQSLIRENLGIEIGLERLQEIMYWEGMLPAKDYGIPKWYIDKHMTPLHVKQRRAELKKVGPHRNPRAGNPLWHPHKRKDVAKAI